MKTIEEIKEIYKDCFLGPIFAKADSSYMRKHTFIKVYGVYPYIVTLTTQINRELLNDDSSSDEDMYPLHTAPSDNTIYNVNFNKTRKNFKNLENIVNINGVIFGDGFMIDTSSLIIYSLGEKLPDVVESNITYNSRENKIKYVYKTPYGYETKLLDVKSQNNNLDENYNNDLPHEAITNFVNSAESGISILYGEAGTGKTSYIRHLIDKNPQREFFWMDQSAFYEMNSAEFIEFLCDMKNAVVILEDCEMILRSRENESNSVLSSILNLSDGILGDSLNIKFICTFNTSLKNIDSALLRKGRLKMQYEFGKLSKEKVEHLFKKLDIKDEPKEMALCEVYNYLQQNKVGDDKNKQKRIGF